MRECIWLFPLIFIFHDMEEIIGLGIWLKNNSELLKDKYPWAIKSYHNFSTEGFSLAVFEELVLCIAFSIILYLTNNPIISYLWIGGFMGMTLHFVLHIVESIIIKQYIPATITSIICLPISIIVLIKCFTTIGLFTAISVLFMILGIVIVAVNLKFAQKLIGWFTVKLKITPLL